MLSRVPSGVLSAMWAVGVVAMQIGCAQQTTAKDSPRVPREPVGGTLNFSPTWVSLRSVDTLVASQVVRRQAQYAFDTWFGDGVVWYRDYYPFDWGSAPTFDSLDLACAISLKTDPPIVTAATQTGLDTVRVFPVTKYAAGSGRVDSLASFDARSFVSHYRPTPTSDPLVVLVPVIGYLDNTGMVTPDETTLGITPGVLDRAVDGSIFLSSARLAVDTSVRQVPLSHEMVHLLDDVPHVFDDVHRPWYKICHIFSRAAGPGGCGTPYDQPGEGSWIWNAVRDNPVVIRTPKWGEDILTLVQTSGAQPTRNQCLDARTLQRFLWF